MLAKKTSKNQVTLPKAIADRFPGTEYFDVQVRGRAILMRPVRIEPEEDERPGLRPSFRGMATFPSPSPLGPAPCLGVHFFPILRSFLLNVTESNLVRC